MHLKILHLWFGPTTPPINTGCSQKRLTGGESVLPLWDTDAYGTWSGGPGGDKRGRVGWSCLLFFFFEYETWGEIKKKKKKGLQKDQSELSSWQVKWAGRSSPQHGPCQKTIKENIFRLTTSGIKKLHAAMILKSEPCAREADESQPQSTSRLSLTYWCLCCRSVWVQLRVVVCVSVGVYTLVLESRKDTKKESRLHIYCNSQQVRGETGGGGDRSHQSRTGQQGM